MDRSPRAAQPDAGQRCTSGRSVLSDLAIRPAYSTDAPQLAALRWEFRTALNPAAEGKDDFILRCERWIRIRLDQPQWRAWVAERDRAFIGTVWVELIEKMPNPVAEPEKHAYLTNFYVQDAERGKGIGTRLLEAAIAECSKVGVQAIILWPTPRSTPLYERMGFEKPGRLLEKLLAPDIHLEKPKLKAEK